MKKQRQHEPSNKKQPRVDISTAIGHAVVGHEGSTLIVVFNGLRLLVYQSKSQ